MREDERNRQPIRALFERLEPRTMFASIANGSFENLAISTPYVAVYAGANTIQGWTVAGAGGVDIVRYWSAASGSQSLDLSGDGGAGVTSISQTLTGLTVGTQYRVTFALAGNPTSGPVNKDLNVIVGSTKKSYTFSVSGTNFTNMGWSTKTFDFTAAATTATLRFESPVNSGGGPALDNVSIAPLVTPGAEAEVRGNNVVIADNDGTASAADFTDFGTRTVGSPLTRTFTVRNTGTVALTTSGLSVPAGFSIDPTDALASSIAAGGQDTFKVKLNATAAGRYSGNVSFGNNDSNENPYNFAITGIVNSSTFNLANNVLTITGTNSNDFVRGQITANLLTMRMNSLIATYTNASSISRIVLNVLNGNDLVLLSQSVNRPTSLNGGDGNDTITGGSGADVINGGNGIDVATKNTGDTVSLVEEILA